MIRQLLEIINNTYPLKKMPATEFDGIKVMGMRFHINSFTAKGLGHVSTMSAKGFFGLMCMDTLIVNPMEKDLPLMSYDRIKAMGNDKLYVEFYDTMVEKISLFALDNVKNSHPDQINIESGPNWYDDIRLPQTINFKGKKADSETFDQIAREYFKAYTALEAPVITDKSVKKAKSDYYVDGLLNNGGPATDVFLKALGKEKTTVLFKEVLF